MRKVDLSRMRSLPCCAELRGQRSMRWRARPTGSGTRCARLLGNSEEEARARISLGQGRARPGLSHWRAGGPTLVRASPLDRHYQRRNGEFGAHMIAHCPADHLRVKRSGITARQSQPSRVGMSVMSASQTRSGRSATKVWLSRFGATGRE